MLVSTFLNIVFIPVLYVVVRSIGRQTGPGPAAETEPA
jgi:hypothetical protein